MTKQTEDALKMAYDWLNEYAPPEVVQACKEALEQPAQEPYDLVAILNDPMQAYPANFTTAKKGNALLFGLCQEAADEIQRLQHKTLEQPAQEPVAWKHFDKAYSKACNSSQPQDWMDAALLAQQARNTHPAPVCKCGER